MGLKDELAQSRKLDPRVRTHLRRLPGNTDPDTPLFDLTISAAPGMDFPGITIGTRAGGIYTARDVSLNNLKALVDNPKVSYVGGGRMYPDARPGGPG